MSALTIYRETGAFISHTEDPKRIAAELEKAGIIFERWAAPHAISSQMSHAEILAAYKTDIDALIKRGGYTAVDVVNMHPDHPDKTLLREKFLSEHIHKEDEIRFFVSGQGLFTAHVADKVYSILCCQNDLINLPAGTSHWFDMGNHPQFTAIRFFNNPEGWVAHYTGFAIAEHFPLYE